MTHKPSITIKRSDLQKLENMLDGLDNYSKQAEDLDQELARANIVEDDTIDKSIVTMNSKVWCRDDINKRKYKLTLVYPHETSMQDSVSVLTSFGSALLGLAVGQKIDWQTPEGKNIRLTVLKVEH